ncbi:hypothetical protein NC796_10140 [Aliifodinibius sp. S!AR15-10]|uniref:hypothetical protein n=1 Tax=Aliifodinibius sp. S!AR15-10 TaxID=2950437 RepID=UPI00285A4679|nr:hypothetical protein [Aliifodinibius sp. S!AR15-10]MDR8391500.1 hypothetical protein [Aliifodinibius sp. S!AR15-10]
MPKTYNRVDEMPITRQKVVKPSISTEHLAAKVDEINCQYHDFNRLHLTIDETRQRIQVNYINEDGFDAPLTGWLDMGQIGTYLENYQRMFCLDPNRLDRFFDMTEATAILPICWLQPTRRRPKGIANAFIYMRQAYQGIIPRRKPISIKPNKEENSLFDIVDGNSTYFVAESIGMTSLPVVLI